MPCSNPACEARMPLLNSFALSRRKNREAWLAPEVDAATQRVHFRVRHGSGCPKQGTVTRRGATCLVCGTSVPLKEVREQAQAGGLGSQLVCIVAKGARGRSYVEASEDHVDASLVPTPDNAPAGSLPTKALGFRVPQYGMSKWADLFTPRQLTTMCKFTALLPQVREQVVADAVEAGFNGDDRRLHEGGSGPIAYADAVTHYLALALGRLANRTSSSASGTRGVTRLNKSSPDLRCR